MLGVGAKLFAIAEARHRLRCVGKCSVWLDFLDNANAKGWLTATLFNISETKAKHTENIARL